MESEQEKQEIVQWIEQFFSDQNNLRENLVTCLQALQDRFGFLPKIGLRKLAEKMKLSPANVFGVATFYNQFRFVPPGKHPVKVCMGTACAIKQGQLIQDQWERRLGIKVGEVTEDREYSLDRVDCVGCCTLAPVSLVSDEVIGGMAVTKVDGILLQHKIKKEQEARKLAAAEPKEDS